MQDWPPLPTTVIEGDPKDWPEGSILKATWRRMTRQKKGVWTDDIWTDDYSNLLGVFLW